jgi:hypothetical protein
MTPTPPPVIPHQISRIARTAIYNRLIDPELGFNPLIAYQNYQYNLKPPINAVEIGPKSRNFIFGQIAAATEIGTTSFKFPLVALYTHGIMNKTFIKFRQFSGQVVMGLDVWWSWTNSNVVQDFENYGDAIEEVVVEIINGFGPSGNGAVTQNWGHNLVYNGGVSCSRTALAADADNWLQGYQFRFTFHLDTDVP